MFASRQVFGIVVLLWFYPFTIKDALAISPEFLCCHVFRFGFTPYNPMFIFLEIYAIPLLIFGTEADRVTATSRQHIGRITTTVLVVVS